jgi:hypothetical protein
MAMAAQVPPDGSAPAIQCSQELFHFCSSKFIIMSPSCVVIQAKMQLLPGVFSLWPKSNHTTGIPRSEVLPWVSAFHIAGSFLSR